METYRITYQKNWPKPTDAALRHFLKWVGSDDLWTTSNPQLAHAYCAMLNLANAGNDMNFQVYVMD